MKENLGVVPYVFDIPSATEARAVLDGHLIEAEDMLDVTTSLEQNPSQESIILGAYLRFCSQDIISTGLPKDSPAMIRERLGFFYEETRWHIGRARDEGTPIPLAIDRLLTTNFNTAEAVSIPVEMRAAKNGLSRLLSRRRQSARADTAITSVA